MIRTEAYEENARRADGNCRSSGTRVCRRRQFLPRLDLESSECGEEHKDKSTSRKASGNRTVEVCAATRNLGGSRAGIVSSTKVMSRPWRRTCSPSIDPSTDLRHTCGRGQAPASIGIWYRDLLAAGKREGCLRLFRHSGRASSCRCLPAIVHMWMFPSPCASEYAASSLRKPARSLRSRWAASLPT